MYISGMARPTEPLPEGPWVQTLFPWTEASLFPKDPALPYPGLLLLMEFAEGFKGRWRKECGPQLGKLIQ